MTKTQDEALIALATVLRKAQGAEALDAYLLVDAIRRGSAEEQKERTAQLLDTSARADKRLAEQLAAMRAEEGAS